MKIKEAAQCIAAVTPAETQRYIAYLNSIKPITAQELFKRWLFAFASVHTTWRMNCRLYSALAGMEWVGDINRLKATIQGTGAGLHNNRTRYIYEFAGKFWNRPGWYWRQPDEDWVAYRDRVCAGTVGIGRAKSSFVIEMTYPDQANVICTDTHVMQWFGFRPQDIGKGKVNDATERLMEECWVELARSRGVPPVIARWVAWDKKQGQPSSRYWTRVFEQPKLLAAPTVLAGVATTILEEQENGTV